MQIWSAEIKELETLYTSIKVRFPELEKELEQLIETKDANVVMLYSRRCLEVIVTDLCECELKRPRKTEPLKGIIDKLHHEEKIPSHIITSMQNLNSLSTYGAHPKEFDPEQVKPVLNNLTTIIKWYLKFKDTKIDVKAETVEVKDETKVSDDTTEKIQKPKKRLILLLSGIVLIVVIVVMGLFVFDVIIGREIEKSIAVLPFKNFSVDPDQEYMSDGLTDEIINHLYKIESFDKVVSLGSVMTYKGTDKKIPQIADELKVNYVLEGTYKKIGDQIRVTAQLIEAINDKHIWQNDYNQPYQEIISIQADIALQIADHVKAFITSSERQYIKEIPTTNHKAYELIRQALHLWYTRGYIALDQIINLAFVAIQLDPNYADAYATAGMFTLYKGGYAGGSEMLYVSWDALRLIEKALELNQDVALGHTDMGLINDWVKWDFIKAETDYLKAIELEPNNWLNINRYVEFLLKMNRSEDALSYFNLDIQIIYDRWMYLNVISSNKKGYRIKVS